MELGFDCKEYLQEHLDKDINNKIEIDVIRENCLSFYVKASEQIRDRLPIDDPFLRCVAVFEGKSALLDPDRESTIRKVLYVNHRLGRIIEEQSIKNEWKSLYEVDLARKLEWSKLSFDNMWTKISLSNTVEGDLRFQNLRSLLNNVRSLPQSNAEVERAFSLIPDTKTRKRNKLSIETVNSSCVIKSALKNNNKTARTMIVTHEHLALMTAENLYTKSHSEKKTDIIQRTMIFNISNSLLLIFLFLISLFFYL